MADEVKKGEEISGLISRLKKYKTQRKLKRAQRVVYFAEILKGGVKKL